MPLNLADFAEHLNTAEPPDPSRTRTEMQRALDSAVYEVTRATGWLDGVTVTTSVRGSGRGVLRLPYVRLAAVGPVVDPGGVVAVPADVDLAAGIVTVYGRASSGAWTVTVTGTPWPPTLATAALDWAAHLYDTQRAVIEGTDDDEPPPSFALPNRVEELLRPYRLAGAA